MIICPACGSNVDGQLSAGCPSCGARAVGPPLAKPEHQLLSYGPALVTGVSGALMLLAFLGATTATWVSTKGGVLRIWAVANAGEVTAWQAKWIAPPIALATIWFGFRFIREIKRAPERLAGLRAARAGFSMAIVCTLMVGALIGVTVPERLRRRQWSIDAASYARGYTLHRALQEYRELHGTLPPQEGFIQELKTLPDPDGSIAEALRFVESSGYQAKALLAAASTKSKGLAIRGAVLRNASANITPDPPGVSFTSYELRLPGPDKVLNTDDDFVVKDGVVSKVSDLPVPPLPGSSQAGAQ